MRKTEKIVFEENSLITSFWGTGSSGATTYALEYATQLARHGRKTLLVDFDLTDPTMMVYLAIDEYPSGLQAGLRLVGQQRLDPTVIPDLTVQSKQDRNLYFLAGLPAQGRFEAIDSGTSASMLRAFSSWFDELVVDLGKIMPEVVSPKVFDLQQEVLAESDSAYGIFRADPEGVAKLFWSPITEYLLANLYRPGSLGAGGKKAMKAVVAEVSGSSVIQVVEEDEQLVRALAKALSVGDVSKKSPISQAVSQLIQNREVSSG